MSAERVKVCFWGLENKPNPETYQEMKAMLLALKDTGWILEYEVSFFRGHHVLAEVSREKLISWVMSQRAVLDIDQRTRFCQWVITQTNLDVNKTIILYDSVRYEMYGFTEWLINKRNAKAPENKVPKQQTVFKQALKNNAAPELIRKFAVNRAEVESLRLLGVEKLQAYEGMVDAFEILAGKEGVDFSSLETLFASAIKYTGGYGLEADVTAFLTWLIDEKKINITQALMAQAVQLDKDAFLKNLLSRFPRVDVPALVAIAQQNPRSSCREILEVAEHAARLFDEHCKDKKPPKNSKTLKMKLFKCLMRRKEKRRPPCHTALACASEAGNVGLTDKLININIRDLVNMNLKEDLKFPEKTSEVKGFLRKLRVQRNNLLLAQSTITPTPQATAVRLLNENNVAGLEELLAGSSDIDLFPLQEIAKRRSSECQQVVREAREKAKKDKTMTNCLKGLKNIPDTETYQKMVGILSRFPKEYLEKNSKRELLSIVILSSSKLGEADATALSKWLITHTDIDVNAMVYGEKDTFHGTKKGKNVLHEAVVEEMVQLVDWLLMERDMNPLMMTMHIKANTGKPVSSRPSSYKPWKEVADVKSAMQIAIDKGPETQGPEMLRLMNLKLARDEAKKLFDVHAQGVEYSPEINKVIVEKLSQHIIAGGGGYGHNPMFARTALACAYYSGDQELAEMLLTVNPNRLWDINPKRDPAFNYPGVKENEEFRAYLQRETRLLPLPPKERIRVKESERLLSILLKPIGDSRKPLFEPNSDRTFFAPKGDEISDRSLGADLSPRAYTLSE